MHYFIALFILYEVIVGFAFYQDYSNKHYDIHENKIKLFEHTFESTVKRFELANDHFHSQHVFEMSRLTHLANDATKEQRDKIREEILKIYMPFFSAKKIYSLEGMHIFDKNGHSLLRLHKLGMHDDHIIDLRDSLKNMEKNFSYQKGVEIGVYKDAYRFQYPLFYDGNFVGSYEYSVPFGRFKKDMKEFFAQQYMLIYNAKNIETVSSTGTIKKRYKKIQVDREEFYYQPSSHYSDVEMEHFEYIRKLENVQKALFLNDTKVQVVPYSFKGDDYDLLIKPILDISGKHIGYLLVHIINDYIDDLKSELFRNIFMATLLSLILFISLLKQIKHKTYVRELINRQEDILVVTNGRKIKDANLALVKFFGYKTFKEFERDNECICNFFIKNEGFLQKENDGIIWTDYLVKYPNKKHQVQMEDRLNNSIKTFELEYKVLQSLDYIFIVFKDITEKEKKINQLFNRASYDALTGIYNRSSFDYYLDKELKRSSRTGGVFSLIMFDIDHFKMVNDNYGHDIGDYVLKELVEVVSSHIRETDIFARWGGEEFMIIATSNIGMSGVFAEKLRATIEAHHFNEVEKVTCSFGVAEYKINDTRESITKRSDTALYNAKASGRNIVSVELRDT